MPKKVQYSKTARERKAEKRNETVAVIKKDEKETVMKDTVIEEEVVAEGAVSPKKKMKTRDFIILMTSIGLIFILAVVLVVVYFLDDTPDIDNPVAVMTLNNGMKLEFELYYDIAPYAVSNFISLANLGVYNDTPFHQLKNGYLTGGYYKRFTTTDTNITGDRIYAQYKFYANSERYHYTVNRSDSNTYSNYGKGYISIVQGSTNSSFSTSFRICLEDVESMYRETGIVFGIIRGNMDALTQLNKAQVDSQNAPISLIKITKVTIKAKDSKWKKYHFFDDHEAGDWVRGNF